MNSFQKKLNKFFLKFKDKNFLKGISTLVGASCLNFLNGGIFSLCTLLVYEISYVKAKGSMINIDHLTFYYPMEIFFQCVSEIISGFIYKEMGLHVTNLIGVTILCLGYFIMFISSSLFLDLLSMALGGIGTGIIFYPSATNTIEWFKNHNGIIMGIMETMTSFGSFIFSFIGEKIININEIPSNNIDNLYDFEIAKKIKNYLIFQIISLVSALIISYLLMYEKSYIDDEILNIEENSKLFENENKNFTINIKKDEDSNENNLDIEDKNKINENIEKEEVIIDDNSNINKKGEIKIKENKNKEGSSKIKNSYKKKIENDNQTEEDKNEPLLIKDNNNEIDNINEEQGKKDIKNMLKLALKSKNLIIFVAIVLLQSPVVCMAFALYREIGEYKKIDTKYLQLIGSLYFVFECLSSFVFGLLCDYIKLKYLFYFINFIGTTLGFLYCFTFKNGLLFFIVQNILSFSAGGYYPVKDCFLMKVYGKDLYIELSGYVSFLIAIVVNLLTPITYFVHTGLEEKDTSYWILFLSFGTLNLIGLILNFFLEEKPIDLEEMLKKNKKK